MCLFVCLRFFFFFCFVLFHVLAAFLYFIGVHFGASRMLSLACADFKLFFRAILISLVAVDIMCLRNVLICIIIAATRSKTSSESKRGNQEEDDIQMPVTLVKATRVIDEDVSYCVYGFCQY